MTLLIVFILGEVYGICIANLYFNSKALRQYKKDREKRR